MPRTTKTPKKRKPGENGTSAEGIPATTPAGEVLTLAEAASYLRLPEAEVARLVHSDGLPGRATGKEWRFLKTAIQDWLRKPAPQYSLERQLAAAGTFKDDPDLLAIVEDAYRKRGRPITEDGSYDLLHGLETGRK